MYHLFSNIKFFVLFLPPMFLMSQESDIYKIRGDIYDKLVYEITKESKNSSNLIFFLDPTINKFDDVYFDGFNLSLSKPKYEHDSTFCKLYNKYECKSKFDLDSFFLKVIHNDHEDNKFPIYYGIYAPIDTWYQLIYYALFKKTMRKQEDFVFEIFIPIKKVFFENKFPKSEYFFYRIKMDDNFLIIDVKKMI